jgi:hypothetical protein
LLATTQYVSARPAAPAPLKATQFLRPSRPVKVAFAASVLLLSRLPLFLLLGFIHCFRPKQKAHSRLVSGLQGKLLKLLLLCHPPDVPNKKIEQHELFEHIFGIWRSAVIGDEILTTALDVCQAQWIRIIFSGIESFQFETS